MRKIDIISQLNILLVKELEGFNNILFRLSDGIDLAIKRSVVYVSDKRMEYDAYTLSMIGGEPEFFYTVAVRNNNTIELARFILDKLGKQTTMKLLELNAGE